MAYRFDKKMSVRQHAALCEHWAHYWTYSDATYQLYDFCFTLCLVGLLLFLWKDKLFDWSNGIIIFFASSITFLGLLESSFLIVVWNLCSIRLCTYFITLQKESEALDNWSQFKKYNSESQPRIRVLDSVLKSGIEDYCYSILEGRIVLAEALNQKRVQIRWLHPITSLSSGTYKSSLWSKTVAHCPDPSCVAGKADIYE